MNLEPLRTIARRLFVSGAVALLVAALLGPAVRVSADEVDFESVKKGKATLDEGEVIWQALVMPTAEDDEGERFAPGFLYAAEDPIVIARAGSDQTLPLRKGAAFTVSPGARLVPTSANGDEAEFLSVGVLPEDDADEPAGEAFEVEEGEYALELLRAEMPRVQPGGDGPGTAEFEADDLPALIVVLSGEVEVSGDDIDAETMEEGDALAVTGEVQFAQASPAEAIILAVTISGDDDGDREDEDDDSRPADAGGMGATSGGGAAGGAPAQQGGHANQPAQGHAPAPTNDHHSDNDGDGLTLERETMAGTHPDNHDTDGDGLGDGDEVDHFATNPLMHDTDSDGLLDGDEVLGLGTDPNLNDSDYDGLGDLDELAGTAGWVTNPLASDTDGDGLDDLQETTIVMTDPTYFDTDADGISDNDEVMNGTNPHVPDSAPTDTGGTDAGGTDDSQGTDGQTDETDQTTQTEQTDTTGAEAETE